MKNEITPTPWRNAVTHILGNAPVTICRFGDDNKNWEVDRSAIVSAINNTYGSGINPEAVPGLMDAIVELVSAFDNLVEQGDTTVAKNRINRYVGEAKAAIEKATIK